MWRCADSAGILLPMRWLRSIPGEAWDAICVGVIYAVAYLGVALTVWLLAW